ncbi:MULTISPECIES: FAD:protein FMN transferase [Marinobacter]|uniref:FAD:protein FMN transferase n=1 Tax=Marinobacter profundi TaxID=2666256 RepID=A0A2G1UPI8_9GAMM|nr:MULTISPECIES: FAD:protein FMN transferase [Marinobacter]MBD3656443.1 FAD:protein FMN transferase [Marinobacter sp.]PHQ16427.1 FAD:protein FMN transferase ApbE [Marinobacter profundi]
MTSRMLRPARVVLASVLWTLALAALAGCSFQSEEKIWEIAGPVFGTSYHINVVLTEDPQQLENLAAGIRDVLDDVDASMSTWRPDSELSSFNQREDQSEWVAISAPLYEVMAAAVEVSELSAGAFDVTVGPVVNLWGFGPQARPDTVPDQVVLQQVLDATGYENLELRANPPALRANGRQYIDLSAIAKGYGVDAVARYLDTAGVRAYLVEIGGEVRVKGRKPGGDAWRLAIEEPVSERRQVNRVVALDGQAMATSGDYRNYYESEGQRYSHTIDPETGRPIGHNLASVSVIAENCMKADALATAFNVMGYDKAQALATRENIAAYFIVRGENGFESFYTPAFSSFLTR